MKLLVVVLAVAVCSVVCADAFRVRREEAAAPAAEEAKAAEEADKPAEGENVNERYGYRPQRPGYSTYTSSQTYTAVQQGGYGGGIGAGYAGAYNPAYPAGGAAAYGTGYGQGYPGSAAYGPGVAYPAGAGYPGGYGAGYSAGYPAGAAYNPAFGASGAGYGGGIGTQYGEVPVVNFQSVGPNGRPAVSYESSNFGFYLRDKNAAKDGAAAEAAAAEKPKEEAVAFGSR